MEYVQVSEFRKGDIIFHKGDDGDRMYEIIAGDVGLYLNYRMEGEQLLAVKEAGQFFGEIALLETRPRTATAVSLDDQTKLRTISTRGFVKYFQERPEILQAILNNMSDRFKMQRRQYFDACEALKSLDECIKNEEPVPDVLRQKIDKMEAALARYESSTKKYLPELPEEN